MPAYEMEKEDITISPENSFIRHEIFFAQKGTGDIGSELKLENGVILKRESRLHGKDYFSIFGKFKVPRTCYRLKGFCGIMPLDAHADLPDRCYSYLL